MLLVMMTTNKFSHCIFGGRPNAVNIYFCNFADVYRRQLLH